MSCDRVDLPGLSEHLSQAIRIDLRGCRSVPLTVYADADIEASATDPSFDALADLLLPRGPKGLPDLELAKTLIHPAKLNDELMGSPPRSVSPRAAGYSKAGHAANCHVLCG